MTRSIFDNRLLTTRRVVPLNLVLDYRSGEALGVIEARVTSAGLAERRLVCTVGSRYPVIGYWRTADQMREYIRCESSLIARVLPAEPDSLSDFDHARGLWATAYTISSDSGVIQHRVVIPDDLDNNSKTWLDIHYQTQPFARYAGPITTRDQLQVRRSRLSEAFKRCTVTATQHLLGTARHRDIIHGSLERASNLTLDRMARTIDDAWTGAAVRPGAVKASAVMSINAPLAF